jgi:hypothetical protein
MATTALTDGEVLFSGWGRRDTHAGRTICNTDASTTGSYGMVGVSGFKGTVADVSTRADPGFRTFSSGRQCSPTRVSQFLRATNNNTVGTRLLSERGIPLRVRQPTTTPSVLPGRSRIAITRIRGLGPRHARRYRRYVTAFLPTTVRVVRSMCPGSYTQAARGIAL